MSRPSLAAISILLLAATSSWAEDRNSRMISGAGLMGPEGVRHDTVGDRYLRGNLGQRGAANEGFIFVIDPDLSVGELKWIEGGREGVTLQDPLGLIISGDVIHVADVASVRRFDRSTGGTPGSTHIPGAVRLNDLAIDPSGKGYVTDSGSEATSVAICRVSAGGGVSIFAEREAALLRPNGIAVLPDGLLVHGGLGGAVLVFSDAPERIVRERTLPSGLIDGIVALPDGSLLVASQDGHRVYLVDADEPVPPHVVAGDIAVPAAIGADVTRRLVLVPQITASSITVVSLP